MSLVASVTFRAEQPVVLAAIMDLLFCSSYSVIAVNEETGKIISSTPEVLLLPRQILQMDLSSTDHGCLLSIHIESAVIPGGWRASLYQRLLRRYIFRRLEKTGILRASGATMPMTVGVAGPSTPS